MSDYADIASEIKRNADQIETVKEERKQQREDRKRQKELRERNLTRERLVAPVLLVISLLISALVLWLY
jgi:Mg2+ and Co2+ transporter CorA